MVNHAATTTVHQNYATMKKRQLADNGKTIVIKAVQISSDDKRQLPEGLK
jgi:hypothetical protein